MEELNLRYRGRKGTTDVLAFPMREGVASGLHPHLLGDVVISVEAAVRQSRALGHSLEEELSVLLIHGILHLIGYHHDGVNERKKTLKLQEELLCRFFSGRKHES